MKRETGDEPFLKYLAEWRRNLPALDLASLLKEPDHAAVLSVDLVKGFCARGALASPRVQGIVRRVARLFRRTHELGVRRFLLVQDAHEPDAVEFGAFPPHCVRGTAEAETAEELAALPFAADFTIVPKNSIDCGLAPAFQEWLAQRREVLTFLVVGDCTDLCVYQAAMSLRLRANAAQTGGVRVIVPADCVETYDLPVEAARSIGAMPHAGDLLNLIFLHHMALNGIEVVASAG